MEPAASDIPNLDRIAQLLRAREVSNATVSINHATVTISPQLELLSVDLMGPGIVAEHRDALQQDIIAAVNQAMREVVVASAQMLEGLQASAEIQSVRDALQREFDQPQCGDGSRQDEGES